jgi:hypothetical protein
MNAIVPRIPCFLRSRVTQRDNLLAAHSVEWINACGTARGDVTGDDWDEEKQRRYKDIQRQRSTGLSDSLRTRGHANTTTSTTA